MVVLLLSSGCFWGYYPDYDKECGGPGDLQVRWVFNASPVCPVDATTMTVELTTPEGRALELPGGSEFDCTSREVVLTGIGCGYYNLLVKASEDQDGTLVTTYLSSNRQVLVQTGRISPVTVNLQVAP